MTRYFFHQFHNGQRIEDPEGSELENLEEAHKEAILGALEIMADRISQGRNPDHSYFEICNEQGNVLRVVFFEEAIGSHILTCRPRSGY